MMVSSLAALRDRGGGALESDQFQSAGGDPSNNEACYDFKTLRLKSRRMQSLAKWLKTSP
jgi:hypothetical protein